MQSVLNLTELEAADDILRDGMEFCDKEGLPRKREKLRYYLEHGERNKEPMVTEQDDLPVKKIIQVSKQAGTQNKLVNKEKDIKFLTVLQEAISRENMTVDDLFTNTSLKNMPCHLFEWHGIVYIMVIFMNDKIRITIENTFGSEIKILYDEDDTVLVKNGNDLYFIAGDDMYMIGSNGYEPCTYLIRDGKVCIFIHNAFTEREILMAAEQGSTLTSITGNKYDIGRVCRLLAYAAANLSDASIDYVEGKLAIEKMKELGAFSPETAVSCSSLGIRMISSCFSHSKRLNERVMTTDDGKVYLKIKNSV